MVRFLKLSPKNLRNSSDFHRLKTKGLLLSHYFVDSDKMPCMIFPFFISSIFFSTLFTKIKMNFIRKKYKNGQFLLVPMKTKKA